MTQLDRWIGNNVERLRKRHELNQVDVAERMSAEGFKWSQRTVWAVEKGERPLRLAEAQVLSRGLKVGLEELVGTPEAMSRAHKIFDASSRCRHAVSSVASSLQEAQSAMNIAQFELHELAESGSSIAELVEDLPDPTVGKFLNSMERIRRFADGGMQAFFNEAMEELHPESVSQESPDAEAN